MKANIVKTLCALVLGLTAAATQAIPLADLYTGGEIVVGDKRFYDWVFEGDAPLQNQPPVEAANVQVTAVGTGVAGDWFGLAFDFGNELTTPFDDTDDSETGYWFSYAVEVLDPGKRIVGTSLELTGFTAPAVNFGFLEVTGHVDGLDLIFPDTEVYAEFGDEVLSNMAAIGPTSALTMDTIAIISAWALDDPMQISTFEQRFEQQNVQVPVPGTLALLALGLFSLASRRRQKGHA